jgi:hypothetical protein
MKRFVLAVASLIVLASATSALACGEETKSADKTEAKPAVVAAQKSSQETRTKTVDAKKATPKPVTAQN